MLNGSLVLRIGIALLVVGGLNACAPAEHTQNSFAPAQQDLSSENPDSPVNPDQPIPNSLCSTLNFSGVRWPTQFTAVDEIQLTAGLNISGSFEGHEGWRNLANDFDGQGMSMGLLNQTLGQGSLQPLLYGLDSVINHHMGVTRGASLIQMVKTWKGTSAAISSKGQTAWSLSDSSPLDEDWQGAGADFVMQGVKENQSVAWARANLYRANGTFIPEWKRGLQSLAADPAYVTRQVEAAQQLHRKALAYMLQLNFIDLRSYSFFFDIVVQNGGLNSSEIQYLKDLVRRQPTLSVADQLKALMEKRLLRVKSQWRADVRSRKLSLIQGRGTVHGASRNYPQELCLTRVEWESAPEPSQIAP